MADYIPSTRISLRDAGYNEQWLQNRILEDPSLLGLGDLKVIDREVKQRSNGRLDFIMSDIESGLVYEVELMLGATDESHIIRTIEYWDIERRRRPHKEHRAVIVAEEITSRFFNVIGLFSQSIPLIAVKLDVLKMDNSFTLSFSTVLDWYQAQAEDDESAETESIETWKKYADPASFQVFENFLPLISSNGKKPRVTYNADHIAVGGARINFAWFKPKRKSQHCIVEFRVGEANVASTLESFSQAGLNGRKWGAHTIQTSVTVKDLSSNNEQLQSALQLAIKEGGGL